MLFEKSKHILLRMTTFTFISDTVKKEVSGENLSFFTDNDNEELRLCCAVLTEVFQQREHNDEH